MQITRRSFVKGAAALGAAAIVPRYVLGGPGFIPPSDRISVAFVGVGSQGLRVMMELLRYDDIQAVAVCDVNSGSGDYVEWGNGELRGKARELIGDAPWGQPGAWAGLSVAQDIVQRYYSGRDGRKDYRVQTWTDYREMLDELDGFDGVVIGTPDHLHAPVAMAAMRRGKHVYCQKPMAHTVHEARAMAELARTSGVATQVATGNNASEESRVIAEWIADGAIGPVREVHNWSNRPFWPQGIEAPTEEQPVPEYLNWDLWLGPAAYRPFHQAYQPFIWRGWFDFGTGCIGDMGCYSFDTIFHALHLDAPEKIEATSTPVFPESYPLASTIHFHFPARGNRPPVVLHWYDGGIRPPVPEEIEGPLTEEGLLFVGDRGKILCDFMGGNPQLLPESAMRAYEPPEPTLPRSIGHYEEWFAACRGGEPAGANFEVAGPITETILLGNAALRSREILTWSAADQNVRPDSARELLHMTYREGWSLET